MRFLRTSIIAASALLSFAACAETVKITNIGHGYYSGALYVAKREKLFEKMDTCGIVGYVTISIPADEISYKV